MKHYIVAPKKYISERFIIDYFDYTKAEALKKYKEKFPNLSRKKIEIYQSN